jgi:hypothetical protein
VTTPAPARAPQAAATDRQAETAPATTNARPAGRIPNPGNLAVVRPSQTVPATQTRGRFYDHGYEGRRRDDPRAGLKRRLFDWTSANIQRMLFGYAPTGHDGMPVNLHHRGQQPNYYLDEYSATQHQEQSDILHDPDQGSLIDRDEFAGQRSRYWISRVRDYLSEIQ